MIEGLIDKLIKGTLSDALEWAPSSNPFEVYTYFENIRYSIKRRNPLEYIPEYQMYKWSKNGSPILISDPTIEQSQNQLSLLYDNVMKKKPELDVRYNLFKKEMIEDKETREKNISVSLHKVMGRLGFETMSERPIIHIIESNYFYYRKEDSDNSIVKYVLPPMSQLNTAQGITPLQDAQVVLISAPGATGKTAMSQYISNKLNIPIFNLGNFDAVGANTISGLLLKDVVEDDIFLYHGGLKSGDCSLIIDGLDEASIKVTQDGFEAFLKDVASFAKGAKGLPFVILGRPGVMEDASLILEENDVRTCLLEIEPFTIQKAVEFIDNQMNPDYVQRFDRQYKDVRNYIIEQIGGFFKSESELNKKLFERFIGYAPVLQSISSLLNEKQDFHSLLNDLMESKKQKIDLLIDIVKRILERERNKIFDEVLPQVFEPGRPEQFRQEIKNVAGDEEEQCRRVLGMFLKKDIVYNVANEKQFDEKYNEKMTEWIKHHPFFKGNEKSIQNIVFESYLIAMLIDKPECREDVLSYLIKADSCSYLLLDIYSSVKKGGSGEIDYRFFPYLYSSFKTLDHPKDVGTTEIVADDDETNSVKCYLSFGRDEVEMEYEFCFEMNNTDILAIPSPVSAINIDAPINVVLNDNKTEMQAPVSIHCNNLTIETRDLLLSTPSGDMGNIVLDSETFSAMCNDGTVPKLLMRTPSTNNKLLIITDSSVFFPFNDFWRKPQKVSASEKQLYEAFGKLRRMILMFRSHSKGVLARYCEKIDNRIGKSPLGKALIEGLVKEGVLYSDNIMYYINSNKFAEVLGAKYDDIRSSEMNEKTVKFLESLKFN